MLYLVGVGVRQATMKRAVYVIQWSNQTIQTR